MQRCSTDVKTDYGTKSKRMDAESANIHSLVVAGSEDAITRLRIDWLKGAQLPLPPDCRRLHPIGLTE